MKTQIRLMLAGAFALSLCGMAHAGDTPVPAAAAPAAAAPDTAAMAKAAEHEKLMKETVCRSLDDEDTGHHVHHRTCKTRAEWAAYDHRNQSGYDPDQGRVVTKE